MCGIFGIAISDDYYLQRNSLKNIISDLFKFSSTRGREAAGLAINSGYSSINVLKEGCSPREFLKSKKYKTFFNKCFPNEKQKNLLDHSYNRNSISLIGHSRLVTNGLNSQEYNNQPVLIDELVGVHNGIITNEKNLWNNNQDFKREYEVDTEILLKLFVREEKNNNFIPKSIEQTFSKIEGSASIALLTKNNHLVLATNTGALFFIQNKNKNFFAFASERFILQKLCSSKALRSTFEISKIERLEPFEALNMNLSNLKNEKFSFKAPFPKNKVQDTLEKTKILKIIDHTISPKNLKRCKRCILPETYPYIDLDHNGVCRYCRNYISFKEKGKDNLLKEVEKYRSKDRSPDCIVALSGGRDSCYGLHYIKKELGMNPIAFTYDWGLVTDLARRNCARICGKLGVEHIIRTPNISKKRNFVRLNLEAWLKRPSLGMVPILMAGDKAFYHFAREIRKETGIKLVFFSAGNVMEICPYKLGFSGIKDGETDAVLTKVKFLNQFKLLYYYAKEFLLNPSYINKSIFDTAAAYWHTFVTKDDFLYLYHYIEWNEDKIVQTIREEYKWEVSDDTKTTWRIGDGTAAFYNYIYQTMAGFTEDDDMLSNMIRAKQITREEALKKSKEFSKPRTKSLMEYSRMIGFNFEDTLNKINRAKKLY